MHASTILYGLVFLQGAMASPVGNVAAADVEPRATEPEGLETRDIERRAPALGDMPFPAFPSLKKKGQSGGSKDCSSNDQTAVCSSGSAYCCSPDGNGGTKCAISDSCNTDSKIICCNNNSGYQMCIGEIDFNMPVTININIYKGGKGKNGGK
ncbi:hypothetical protein NOF04DRAFT_16637 [Fusarium oxysporum II5]|uniref:Hydrophobin n=3 Tax=Fusarium oxysporum species complex TaxID=171631 RepID=N1RH48_FUSC4|nr:uncharacterized protein FOIG_15140 [Fusarium odoratissimum NRRL 54006]EMT64831.1 hypothetical protein FOC4_g10007522 [Fusarium odoratissimum]EXL91820.1 hypothetical protein FOIG_15140 [Fusarium odoratissimum NRRL 54006]KAK2137880.1 hypothetical protein NOF04DRAFT_16637 [Fusarium oxysporum II5]TXC03791.1 hypothetical protein FocTR4_00002145 [Fusarium oxysporum f. sp. cubense]